MKKMISWNVNGLRAAVGKNFKEVFDSLDADIFCIQETKLQGKVKIDLEFDGYKSYWNYAEKKKAMRAQRYSQKRNQKTYFTA